MDAFIGFSGSSSLLYDTSTIRKNGPLTGLTAYKTPSEVFHTLAGAVVMNAWDAIALLGDWAASATQSLSLMPRLAREQPGNHVDARDVITFFVAGGAINKKVFYAHAPDIYIATVQEYNRLLNAQLRYPVLRGAGKGAHQLTDVVHKDGRLYANLNSLMRYIRMEALLAGENAVMYVVSNATNKTNYVLYMVQADFQPDVSASYRVDYGVKGARQKKAGDIGAISENGAVYLDLIEFCALAGYSPTYPGSLEFALAAR